MFSSTWLLVFGAILALSIRDLTFKMSDQSASPSEEPPSAASSVSPIESKVPDVEKERIKKASYTPRFQPSVPTLKVLYCQS
jgi:hypothetical protein